MTRDFVETNFPTLIPEAFLSRVKASRALTKQFIPTEVENDVQTQLQGLQDPIGDKKYQVTKNLIHRYTSRALFIPTNKCPVHCRYCFRRNELMDDTFDSKEFAASLTYLRAHPEINEVIFTGGDPLMLSDSKIVKLLKAFSEISSIKYIRFHTRMPITNPGRLTDSFTTMWKSFESVFSRMTFVLHTNHIDEFDQKVNQALKKWGPFLTQSVLLKDVNNSKEELLKLFEHIISIGGTPYYLHHPDKVEGAMHFYLSLEEGRKIYAALRDELPGWAIPHYVLDIPGGDGKTLAFNSESYEFSGRFINKDSSYSDYTPPQPQ